MAARPEAATALAMQLCSPAGGSGGDADFVAAASDFAHIYADRCCSRGCRFRHIAGQTRTNGQLHPFWCTGGEACLLCRCMKSLNSISWP